MVLDPEDFGADMPHPAGARARRVTVGELDREHRARLAADRADAHRAVDATYDAALAELDAGLALVEREVEGFSQH